MIEFNIPEKCLSCPIQGALRVTYEGEEDTNEILTELGEHLVGEPGQQFDEIIESSTKGFAADEEIKEVQEAVRKGVAEKMEDVEESQAKLIAVSGMFAAHCNGALKMRAAKGCRQYTVAICTSEEVETNEGAALIPTRIWVK